MHGGELLNTRKVIVRVPEAPIFGGNEAGAHGHDAHETNLLEVGAFPRHATEEVQLTPQFPECEVRAYFGP